MGLFTVAGESQYELLRRLQDQGVLPREVAQLFGEIRREGNAATHSFVADYQVAKNTLKIAWQLGVWFHRTFKDHEFQPRPFLTPEQIQERAEVINTLARDAEQAEGERIQHLATQQQIAE